MKKKKRLKLKIKDGKNVCVWEGWIAPAVVSLYWVGIASDSNPSVRYEWLAIKMMLIVISCKSNYLQIIICHSNKLWKEKIVFVCWSTTNHRMPCLRRDLVFACLLRWFLYFAFRVLLTCIFRIYSSKLL